MHSMTAPTEITAPALLRLLGTADAPTLIDVRLAEDRQADARLIPTSLVRAHDAVASLAGRIGPQGAVLVCQRGRKLSHGAAALLRVLGIPAQVLEGGFAGWLAAGGPVTDRAALPEPGALWVTRARPKIDRIACPWLICRFVDPGARFLFVPPQDVAAVADRFGAIPFDVADVRFTHRDGCTFDAMLDDFGLHAPPLDILAGVIRAADTDRHDLSPQAAGLLAISVGLSRLYRDDLAQLAAAMPLHDALYRWARDGQAEGHDWQPQVQG